MQPLAAADDRLGPSETRASQRAKTSAVPSGRLSGEGLLCRSLPWESDSYPALPSLHLVFDMHDMWLMHDTDSSLVSSFAAA